MVIGFGAREVEISPDSQRALTVSMSGLISLWDLQSGQLILTVSTNDWQLGPQVAFLPDGFTMLKTDQFNAALYDLRTGKIIQPFCPTFLSSNYYWLGMALCGSVLIWLVCGMWCGLHLARTMKGDTDVA